MRAPAAAHPPRLFACPSDALRLRFGDRGELTPWSPPLDSRPLPPRDTTTRPRRRCTTSPRSTRSRCSTTPCASARAAELAPPGRYLAVGGGVDTLLVALEDEAHAHRTRPRRTPATRPRACFAAPRDRRAAGRRRAPAR